MTTIVLTGDPGGLHRVQQTMGSALPERVTVDHCGQHESFERTNDVEVVEGRDLLVFRWIYTTAIVEWEADHVRVE